MKKTITFLGVVTFLALNAGVASACMCASIGTPKTNLAEARAVFRGKVLAAAKGEWIIAVDKVWKGEVGKKVLLRDPRVGTSCESEFVSGQSYIFFTDLGQSGREVIYHPKACTWTTSLTYRHEGELASERIQRELGKGRPPSKSSSKEKRPKGRRKL